MENITNKKTEQEIIEQVAEMNKRYHAKKDKNYCEQCNECLEFFFEIGHINSEDICTKCLKIKMNKDKQNEIEKGLRFRKIQLEAKKAEETKNNH